VSVTKAQQPVAPECPSAPHESIHERGAESIAHHRFRPNSFLLISAAPLPCIATRESAAPTSTKKSETPLARRLTRARPPIQPFAAHRPARPIGHASGPERPAVQVMRRRRPLPAAHPCARGSPARRLAAQRYRDSTPRRSFATHLAHRCSLANG
jgi:hypothetical protein